MHYFRYIGEVKTERAQGPSNTVPSNVQKKKNPIITVTEHTPTPSPDYLSKTQQVSVLILKRNSNNKCNPISIRCIYH